MTDEIATVDDADPVPPTQRYEARVSLSPEEVRKSFETDPDVAWYPNADPPAFGMPGAPPFEAWPDGPNAIVLRSHVPASIQVASPYVLLEIEPIEGGGSTVRACFVRRPPGVQVSRTVRRFTAVVCVFSALGMLAYWIVFPLMLLHPTMWVTFVASIAGLGIIAQYSKNRPTPESMHAFGGPLWGVLGRKLVPHAIGDVQDPFRLKASSSS